MNTSTKCLASHVTSYEKCFPTTTCHGLPNRLSKFSLISCGAGRGIRGGRWAPEPAERVHVSAPWSPRAGDPGDGGAGEKAAREPPYATMGLILKVMQTKSA